MKKPDYVKLAEKACAENVADKDCKKAVKPAIPARVNKNANKKVK